MFRDFHLEADFETRDRKSASKWKPRTPKPSGLARQGLTDDTMAERCDHGTRRCTFLMDASVETFFN